MWGAKVLLGQVLQHGRSALQFARTNPNKLHIWPCERGAGIRGATGNSAIISNATEVQGLKNAVCTSLLRRGVASQIPTVTARFIQSFVRKVSQPLWSEARRQATKRLVYGESVPFFALVGVTLVAGPQQGLVTKEDELEALCSGIREANTYASLLLDPEFWIKQKNSNGEENINISDNNVDEINADEAHVYSFNDLELGPYIDKGCNAVIYAARWNEDGWVSQDTSTPPVKRQKSFPTTVEKETDLDNYGKNDTIDATLVDYFDITSAVQQAHLLEATSWSASSSDVLKPSSVDAVAVNIEAIDASPVDYFDITSAVQKTHLLEATSGSAPSSYVLNPSSVEAVAVTTALPKGYSSTKRVKFKEQELQFNQNQAQRNIKPQEKKKRILKQKVDKEFSKRSGEDINGNDMSKSQYPLAVKMMFNYEAESNAPAILRAMYKEMIPAANIQLNEASQIWQRWFFHEQLKLPAHPNIVEMPCVFVDRIPMIRDSMKLYPDALPQRLNPDGSGRNMSLFCVMKRYDMSLKEYLQEHKPSTRSSLMLFTQLLEAVLHILQYTIAHRDLKTDNILLNLKEGWAHPQLVLTDFGCSLAQKEQSMSVPFPSREADPRQGNAQHMPPEVKGAVPGLFRSVNFGSSDLWACGVLAYEIFGSENPFAASEGMSKRRKNKVLDSMSYKESQLPSLPKDVPVVIKHLVHELLLRNPKHRPSPNVAATLCHLVLWGPSKWLDRNSLTLPSSNEIMQWLLCLTTKVLCEARISRHPVEDLSGVGLKRGSVRWGKKGAVGNEQPHGRVDNSQHKRAQLEYELVSTFLTRVRFNDIVQAIKWSRAF